MKNEDIKKINSILMEKGQKLPQKGTLQVINDKLHMSILGTASIEGIGVINTLLSAGLNCVIDEDITTKENSAQDDEGVVHIWFLLNDASKLWR